MPEPTGPYATLLACAFRALDPEVKRAHQAPLTAVGVMDVAHGSHPIAPVLVRLLGLPAAGGRQRVTLTVSGARAAQRPGGVLRWHRMIGDIALRTRQFVHRGTLIERSGVGSIGFNLRTESGALVYRQLSMHVLGVRIPRAIAPLVAARVCTAACGWRVQVTVEWRGRFICAYDGRMCARDGGA